MTQSCHNRLLTKIITIAGASGSGKTTLAHQLQQWLNQHFSAEVCGLISEDNYYNDFSHLSFNERAALNFDHPSALDHDFLFEQLSSLKNGLSVEIPQYCFKTHSRKEEVETKHPIPFLILEGIHTFHHEQIKKFSDFKIFVDTDGDLCLARRIARDINERARTLESVITQYFETVKPMYEKYTLPQQIHADMVIDGAEPIGALIKKVTSYQKFKQLIAKD